MEHFCSNVTSACAAGAEAPSADRTVCLCLCARERRGAQAEAHRAERRTGRGTAHPSLADVLQGEPTLGGGARVREERPLQPLAPETQLGAHEQHAEYENEVGRRLRYTHTHI